MLEQGQLPDRLGVVLQGDLLVGPGHLALAVAAKGDRLRDGEQRGGRQGGAPPGQPVVPGGVHLGEGGRERGSPVEHDQRSGVRAGPGARPAGGRRCSATSAPGSVVHSAEGSPVVNAIARPGQVTDIGVVVALGPACRGAGCGPGRPPGGRCTRPGGHRPGTPATRRARWRASGCASWRCSASGSHPSASQPRRCRQVRSDGRDVSPASAPASAAIRVLGLLQRQRAEGERHLGAQPGCPGRPPPPRNAPVPADAPVPALSRPWAPIRLVKACTSIAPA